MGERLKGFIFGATLMLISPAFAVPETTSNTGDISSRELAEPTQYFRLTYENAEEAIGQALAERGAGSKVGASIYSKSGDYIFSSSQPISVEIRGLRYNDHSNSFSANLVSISAGKVLSAKAVSGRYNELVEVPVLKRGIQAGEVITAQDIEFNDYAKGRARFDTITDIASLIGKSPIRTISAARPIRERELQRPQVVKRDDLVKIVYSQGAMEISTNGQAMDDGAQGALINVKNLQSDRIIQARVVNSAMVVIDHNVNQASLVSMRNNYAN